MLITVLMSVYNGEKYLRKSIHSVLTQSYKDFEFIIVDDCSSDKTIEIIKSFNDSRIKLLRNDSNLGLSESLNKGIEHSLGKYIARHDDDDISQSNRLQNQLNLFKATNNIDAIFCRYALFDKFGKIFNSESEYYKKEQIEEALRNKENLFAHGAAMIRKKSLIALGGYNTNFVFGQDYELWIRMLNQKQSIIMVNHVGYYHRVSFNCDKKKWQERFAVLVDKREQIGEVEFLRRADKTYHEFSNNRENDKAIKLWKILHNYREHIKLRLHFLLILLKKR